MIQVQMRIQQMRHRKSVFCNELLQCLLLFLIIASGINYSCLQRFLVPHHIAVDWKHIEFKCLNFHIDYPLIVT